LFKSILLLVASFLLIVTLWNIQARNKKVFVFGLIYALGMKIGISMRTNIAGKGVIQQLEWRIQQDESSAGHIQRIV
jgi:hypothetical protein